MVFRRVLCRAGVVVLLVVMFLRGVGGVLGGAWSVFGHCYLVWLKVKGGKGVATYMGIAMALLWPCVLISAAVWLIALALLRYSSVGGMLAAISAPVSAAAFTRFDLVPLFLGLTLIVLWKHSGNIMRLLTGTEPKVGKSH